MGKAFPTISIICRSSCSSTWPPEEAVAALPTSLLGAAADAAGGMEEDVAGVEAGEGGSGCAVLGRFRSMCSRRAMKGSGGSPRHRSVSVCTPCWAAEQHKGEAGLRLQGAELGVHGC